MNDREILDEVIVAKAIDHSGRCGYAQFEPPGDDPITAEQALEGINKIRNSIVGLQTINWSEHIYPLVSLLNRAGVEGLPYPESRANFGTCLEQRNEAIAMLREMVSGLNERVPIRIEVDAFLKRVEPPCESGGAS